jgi:hypothetical protein
MEILYSPFESVDSGPAMTLPLVSLTLTEAPLTGAAKIEPVIVVVLDPAFPLLLEPPHAVKHKATLSAMARFSHSDFFRISISETPSRIIG